VACVGGRPVALTDCLNYGDPEDPGVFHDFSEGVRGIGEAAAGLRIDGESGVPVVSGNVSFYNQSEGGEPILPTPIVACFGKVERVDRVRPMGCFAPGGRLFLLGRLHRATGGSLFGERFGHPLDSAVPTVDLDEETRWLRLLLEGWHRGWVRTAHDVSVGGLLVAAAETMLASPDPQVGLVLSFAEGWEEAQAMAAGFAEWGGVVVEVDPASEEAFRKAAEKHGVVPVPLGEVTDRAELDVAWGGGRWSVRRDELARAHRGRLNRVFGIGAEEQHG
jgi:phosphoribosylformylglycinamidine synthase